MKFNDISVIAFDADDTLWDCQSHFVDVERDYCRVLSPYAGAARVSAELFRTESANMSLLGYGSKAFTISLVENALRVSDGRVTAAELAEIVELGKSLLRLPATPLPEVRQTLEALRGFRLALFTKGELLDQHNKLVRSGLAEFFDYVEVVPDKSKEAYARLCRRLAVEPRRLLMVGNSFRSDIVPALAIGASAVHIPFHVTWQLEHAEEFPHERLVKISRFGEIPGLVR